MRNRLAHLLMLAALGAVFGFLFAHDWDEEEPLEPRAQPGAVPLVAPPAASLPEPVLAPPAPLRPAELLAPGSSNPELIRFRFSTRKELAGPVPPAAAVKRAPARPVRVPKDWLLRGSNPQKYDVRSDREVVMHGTASVLFLAYDDAEVAPHLFGSLMQSVIADPWVGQHVQFSVFLRHYDRSADSGNAGCEAWFRATDSAGAVIAYAQATNSARDDTQWQKIAVVMDVPWSAAEIAYGVNVRGKGGYWIDNAWLAVADQNVPATGGARPNALGVLVQPASERGPLAMPSNMDFEDIVDADETFRRVPRDALDRRRF